MKTNKTTRATRASGVSVTAYKRSTRPRIYIRKDARTKVMALVYGEMTQQPTKNNPDGVRRGVKFENLNQVQFVKRTVAELLPACAWPQWKVDSINQRLSGWESVFAKKTVVTEAAE